MQKEGRPKSLKIIAIQPLDGCKKGFLKILKTGQPYFLYQGYEIGLDGGLSETLPPLPRDFFAKQVPFVEINAIVGENGSGKSTLMELFLMAVNNFASLQKVGRDLVYIDGLAVWVYLLIDNDFYRLSVENEKCTLFQYSRRNKRMLQNPKLSLPSFFYTIAINYSHYAYNELDNPENQRWLSGVFHKNDGYRIPIVLNPFRKEGIIDINSENHLVKARLLANVLRPSMNKETFDFRVISDRYRANHVQLSLNEEKARGVLYISKEGIKVRLADLVKINRGQILNQLNRLYPFGIERAQRESNSLAIDYLFYKLVNICLKYPDYQGYFDKIEMNFDDKLLPNYLEKIISDPSHIAYKIKQTLNFIRFGHIDPAAATLDLDDFGDKIYGLARDSKNRTGELVELLPPPIFNIELMVENIQTRAILPITLLSSGEKQWTYSINSWLYHLNNLDSIPERAGRLRYEKVFLIMEEVELYFHPEMQRRYVGYVLKSIREMGLKRIRSIQICFITHSPFILSDIPDQNILFLERSGNPLNPSPVKTFGGNLHELLAKSFFLKEALVGEFAKENIEDMINKVLPVDEAGAESVPKEKENALKDRIGLIGEDFLRLKLLEMFDEKYHSAVLLDGIIDKEAQIAFHQSEIKRLRNDTP